MKTFHLLVLGSLLMATGQSSAQDLIMPSTTDVNVIKARPFETDIENKMYDYVSWRLSFGLQKETCEVLVNDNAGRIKLRFHSLRAGWDILEFVPKEGKTSSSFADFSGEYPVFDDWNCTNFSRVYGSF